MLVRTLSFLGALGSLAILGISLVPTSLAAPSPDADLTISDLQSLIDKNQVRSVDALLPLLPPSLLRNYTLQFRGNGLQGASNENPRVFLFGETGKTILTFNGGGSLSRGQNVEILAYSAESESFELFDVDFSNSARNPSVKPTIDRNPRVCLSCHQTYSGRIRPFFSPLNRWAGFFGSEGFPLSQEQASGLKQFNSKRKSHPRYQHLQPAVQELKSPRLAPFDSGEPEGFLARPNQRLLQLLYWQNSRSISLEMQRHPRYSKLLPYLALFYTARKSTGREARYADDYDHFTLEELRTADCSEGLTERFERRFQELHDQLGTHPDNGYLRSTLRLQSLFTLLGIPESAVNLSFHGNDPFLMDWELYENESKFLVNGPLLKDFFEIAERQLGGSHNPFSIAQRSFAELAHKKIKTGDDRRFASRLDAITPLVDLNFEGKNSLFSGKTKRCQFFEAIDQLLLSL